MHCIMGKSYSIHKVTSQHCYNIKNTSLREYQDSNYLEFNKHTSLQEVNTTIQRPDDVSHAADQQKLNFPQEGINYVQTFFSCNKCHTKIMAADSGKKILQCTQYKMSQLKSKCKSKILASAFFRDTNKETILCLMMSFKNCSLSTKNRIQIPITNHFLI